jgi:hypothetical protein
MSQENVDRFLAAVEAFNREGMEGHLRYARPDIVWRMDAGWVEDQTYTGYDGLRKLDLPPCSSRTSTTIGGMSSA